MYYRDEGQHQDGDSFLGKAEATAEVMLIGMKGKEDISREDNGITCSKTKQDGIDGI